VTSSSSHRRDDLERIAVALRRATAALEPFTPGAIAHRMKEGDDPVTAADEAVNDVLHATLPRPGEGWLSEETADDAFRLDCRRVWVVDPVDGTREFIQGIPEWCVSIGLVEDGVAVAGGICNPATGETMLGSRETGVTLNGEPAAAHAATSLDGERVLASRSEVNRGEWQRFDDAGFETVPMGSVAYKLGRVGAGLDPVTWTLVPKHEWDVAAGAALVLAAGGAVLTLDGAVPVFNQPAPKLSGLVACAPSVVADVRALLGV
jgi:myo-inositol-1(or 4)-monophosphatase